MLANLHTHISDVTRWCSVRPDGIHLVWVGWCVGVCGWVFVGVCSPTVGGGGGVRSVDRLD